MGSNLGGEMDLSALLNNQKPSLKKKKKVKEEVKESKAYESKMQKLTDGQIDPEQAKIDMYRRSKRVQLLFSVPEILKKEFLEMAIKEGFYRRRNGHKEADQKKFLLEVLRRAGMDIPSDSKLDNRRI